MWSSVKVDAVLIHSNTLETIAIVTRPEVSLGRLQFGRWGFGHV
jgi:hypothetical protein